MENQENVEIEKSNFNNWEYTVKKLGLGDMSPFEYTHILRILAKHGHIECNVYEKDSHGKWHVHGILSLPKKFFRKKLMTHGYHIKLVEIYNLEGWQSYLKKDQHIANQLTRNLDTDMVIEPDKKDEQEYLKYKIDTLRELLDPECEGDVRAGFSLS